MPSTRADAEAHAGPIRAHRPPVCTLARCHARYFLAEPRYGFDREEWVRHVLLHIVVALGAAIVMNVLSHLLLQTFVFKGRPLFLRRCLLFSLRFQERHKEAAGLQAQLAEARLAAL